VASRAFRRTPGFAVLAVTILATGIGASTVMYTLVHCFDLLTRASITLTIPDPCRLPALGPSVARRLTPPLLRTLMTADPFAHMLNPA
jgi:hypothetical protein